MHLENLTKWNTEDLRKLCLEAIKREGITENRAITIVHLRKRLGSEITGWAFYHVNEVCIRVPKPEVKVSVIKRGSDGRATEYELEPYNFSGENCVEFVQVLIHEFCHNKGILHKDLINYKDIKCDWAKEFSIRPTELEEKIPRVDVQLKRYQQVLSWIKSWEIKKKRAETFLKKLMVKKRYYEKELERRNEQ